jgi:hypothetical protein
VDLGALVELNFGAFFGPFRVPNCPVLLGFCVPRELFLDCTFLFILGTLVIPPCSALRVVGVADLRDDPIAADGLATLKQARCSLAAPNVTWITTQKWLRRVKIRSGARMV